jgi:hypothetical protein
MVHIDANGKQHYGSLLSPGDQDRLIDGLTSTLALFGVLNATQSTGRLPVVQPTGNITENNQPFLTLAAIPYSKLTPEGSYLKPLLDIAALNASVPSTFAGVLSLLVSEQMLRPSNDTIKGSIQFLENRLQVEKVPSIIIATLFFVCFTFAVGLLFVSVSNVVPTNPNSIGGTAMIIGPVPEMKNFSENSLAKVSQDLEGREFRSTIPTPRARTNKFRIVSNSALQRNRPETMSGHTESIGWSPFTLRIPVRASAAALCLGMIVSLEITSKTVRPL